MMPPNIMSIGCVSSLHENAQGYEQQWMIQCTTSTVLFLAVSTNDIEQEEIDRSSSDEEKSHLL